MVGKLVLYMMHQTLGKLSRCVKWSMWFILWWLNSLCPLEALHSTDLQRMRGLQLLEATQTADLQSLEGKLAVNFSAYYHENQRTSARTPKFRRSTSTAAKQGTEFRSALGLLCAYCKYSANAVLTTIMHSQNMTRRSSFFIYSSQIRTKTRLMRPFDTDSVKIRIDNCCSRTISGYKSDFIKGTMKPVKNMIVEGFSGAKEAATHTGVIKWTVLDDHGKRKDIIINNSLYVPGNKLRLLSPQHLAQGMSDVEDKQSATRCVTYADKMTLEWNNLQNKKTVTIGSKSSNVGVMYTAPGYKKYHAFAVKTLEDFGQPSCVSYRLEVQDKDQIMFEDNDIVYEEADEQTPDHRKEDGTIKANFEFKAAVLDGTKAISSPESLEASSGSAEDELLRWHYRLSHVSMTRLQRMAKEGYLPKKLATCRMPLCQACIYGKLTRRPWRTKGGKLQSDSMTATTPGQCVSVDQLESPVHGFVGQMKGKLTKMRYKVATVFVDHFSNLSFVHLQSTTNAEETLKAKHEFEAYASSFGVKIRRYHADNGRFAETVWKQDILNKNQQLTFSGVGAHHQNGRAEKRIRDLQDMARTSLIHAHRRWPMAVDVRLWPYAIRHANHSIIHTPFHGQEKTPVEIFSGTNIDPDLKQHHPFGCPAYALDGHIQSGKKGPKWENRARLAIYLGPSLQHAKSVGLLLSLTTGLVSPQFHVRFDDAFDTLRFGAKNVPSNWQHLAGFELLRGQVARERPSIPVGTILPTGADTALHTDSTSAIESEGAPQTQDENIAAYDSDSESISDNAPESEHQPDQQHHITRSGRTVRPPTRYNEYLAYSCDIIQAFSASSDPDVMYLHQAMSAPDRDEFLKAMDKEVQSHTVNQNWEIVDIADVPKGHRVLPAVWAMRRKRDITTREVYKWKARLNIHGGKQEHGINYWDTYAPVASWPAIRLIMIIAVLRKWKTKQLDFVLAFPQAPVETDLFMAIPSGFKLANGKSNKVLKLKNNLYGQKQAGRVWNMFLTEGLIKLGFTQSENEPCIFWRGSVIIIIYTDDTIITGKDEESIDKVIADIGSRFEITTKDSVSDFLGVKITRDDEAGTVTFTQPQLIESVLDDLGLDEKSNKRKLPALATKILHRFDGSPDHNEDWSYRSAIGKINYIEKCTRPELAYASHQCARFSECPKEEHSQAVKLIGRYLVGSKDKGMIFKPREIDFECYCDADFSGNYIREISEEDPTTARSRSGCVIYYAGCPVYWSSKLQTEIALSSTESEYISLSQALREVLPLMKLITEIKSAGFDVPGSIPKVHCKAFEDNSGALEMAKTHKMRPRTKHINIKYHHFREAVQNKEISIWAINTTDQIADIFTKPLGEELFLKFRKLILGW
jgi:hypothetical protein